MSAKERPLVSIFVSFFFYHTIALCFFIFFVFFENIFVLTIFVAWKSFTSLSNYSSLFPHLLCIFENIFVLAIFVAWKSFISSSHYSSLFPHLLCAFWKYFYVLSIFVAWKPFISLSHYNSLFPHLLCTFWKYFCSSNLCCMEDLFLYPTIALCFLIFFVLFEHIILLAIFVAWKSFISLSHYSSLFPHHPIFSSYLKIFLCSSYAFCPFS